MSENKKYDVGILGVWMGCNYGSIMTYYALEQTFESLGYSVLMIDKLRTSNAKDVELEMTHSRRFGNEHYNISPSFTSDEYSKLNALCDTFVVGSDQVWNYGISKHTGKKFYLDFAEDSKRKIAYATSFGHSVDFAPDDERKVISALMKRFDAISMREDDGVNICRDIYGVEATQVLDPVFMVDPEKVYKPLAEKSSHREEEPFIAAYILDPTPEKREALLHVSKKLGGIKIINLLDGLPWLFEENKKKMDLDNCIENLQVEDWLYYLSHAQFVVTDSCHGASFAMIFKKNFISITNKRRGFSRFKSLSNLFGFRDRLVTDVPRILTDDSLFEPVDYNKIDAIMERERKRSFEWLKNAMTAPRNANNVVTPAITPEPANVITSDDVDFENCKIVASMLKEYGISHVVLSSGTRHVQLVKFFENNAYFHTYNVLDERSAGFFAIGLATRLNQPVAVCCTSGTASSNYLTSVSEAYYQRVPVVYITADRYPAYLNQKEAQMVPQPNMYEGVCRKSVTLPVVPNATNKFVSRRLVCDALISMTKGVKGPVHIDVPLQFISRREPAAYRLKNEYKKIDYVDYRTDDIKWVDIIKKMRDSKIAIIYGQNPVVSKEFVEKLNTFADRFNCVIAKEHISNINCKKSVNMFNMLKAKNLNHDMIMDIKPNIVITVNAGTATITRDFVQRYKYNIEHWDIIENGNVEDPYRKLTKVFAYDFNSFIDKILSITEDMPTEDSMFRAWKKYESAFDVKTTDYRQSYAIGKLMEKIPKNSVLHIANSNTIRMASSRPIAPGIKVYCNRGTNGIDGSASTFMGQCAVSKEPCFLMIGDLSFFYDMNSVWNKKLNGNVRIMLFNNNGAGLLKFHKSPAIAYVHNAIAEGWVKDLGFKYFSSRNKEEFDAAIDEFTNPDSDKAMFFEVFC